MPMTPMQAIKKYFEEDTSDGLRGGRKIGLQEMKALSSEERKELAELCIQTLGDTLIIPTQ